MNSKRAVSLAAALSVAMGLAGCAQGRTATAAGARVETRSTAVATPTRAAAPDPGFGSLERVPSSLAPLDDAARAEAATQRGATANAVEIDAIYQVDADSVEPLMLTNETVSLSDFLEAGALSVFPHFELRTPIVANENWSESAAGSLLGEGFDQSGAMIGAIFDESETASTGMVDRPSDQRPWVSAVDETRWNIGIEALDLVGITPQELGFPVLFAGPNNRKKGTTFTVDRRIEVYIAEGDTIRDVAHVLGHEFGHALDVSANSPQDRYRWLVARGLDETTPWWPRPDVSDLTTGAGDFAECFASWRASVVSRSLLAGSCNGQFALLQELWEQPR